MARATRDEGYDSRKGVGRFVPVPILTLREAKTIDFDLYRMTDPAAPPVLFCDKNYPISVSDLDRLVEQDVHTLYVKAASRAKYQSFLRENLQEFLIDERVAPEARYQLLCESASDVLQHAFLSEGAERVVNRAKEFSEHVVELLAGRNVVAYDMFLVMHHDYRTFAHSINVSTYCVLLAEKLGFRDRKDLAAIAAGALLHDIGKLRLPAGAIRDDAYSYERSRGQIDLHPQDGFEELCARRELSWPQLMMVYQHHERLDGQGFPVRSVGAEIHEWARLCAVVNAFDKLSSRKGRASGLSAPQALERLVVRSGSWFDTEMVSCWIAAMEAPRSTER